MALAATKSFFLHLRAAQYAVAAALMTLSLGCVTTQPISKIERPSHWARPVAIDGVPNLHQVAEGLYRSAQPTSEGFRNLEKLGIRTVVGLRAFHKNEFDKDYSMRSNRIPVLTWNPEDEEISQFLEIVSDPNNSPVLVHCQHGADRTGFMCAIYRVAIEGWTTEEAIAEMKQGGFGFHSIWMNLPREVEALNTAPLSSVTEITK